MANEIVQRGIVGRLLRYAQKQQDGQPSTPAGLRTGPYGEQFAYPILHNKAALAEEGAYYSNGLAPNTAAITYGVTTQYTTYATSYPLVVLMNNDNGVGVNLVPDFIRFQMVGVPTSATAYYLTLVVDQYRTPSANFTQVQNAVNHNTGVGSQSISNMYVPSTGTNMTLPVATAAARIIARNIPLRAQVPVTLDEYVIQFGSVDGLAGGSPMTAAAAGASRIVAQVPPVVLNPQEFLLVYLWGPSQAAFPTFTCIEEGHYER